MPRRQVAVGVVAAAVGALAALAGGCFPASTYECDGDAQCSTGEVCARTHECELPSSVRAVRIRWDIEGAAAQSECAARGIGDLTIDFSDRNGAELAFSPVPCAGGLYSIDKLPLAFDQVQLYGYDGNGDRYYGVTIVASDPEYLISLSQ